MLIYNIENPYFSVATHNICVSKDTVESVSLYFLFLLFLILILIFILILILILIYVFVLAVLLYVFLYIIVDLVKRYFQIRNEGGEGVIIRDPNAPYVNGYSRFIYKHKVSLFFPFLSFPFLSFPSFLSRFFSSTSFNIKSGIQRC